jgi:hypothetical protein
MILGAGPHLYLYVFKETREIPRAPQRHSRSITARLPVSRGGGGSGWNRSFDGAAFLIHPRKEIEPRSKDVLENRDEL